MAPRRLQLCLGCRNSAKQALATNNKRAPSGVPFRLYSVSDLDLRFFSGVQRLQLNRAKVIGIGVNRRRAAQMHKQYLRVLFEATFFGESQDSTDCTTFVDRVGYQPLRSRQ